MNRLQLTIISAISILLISCGLQTKKQGDFELLPLPKQVEWKGVSSMGYSDIDSYYIQGDDKIPVRGDMLNGIEPAESEAKAQIVCGINEALDLKAEGYILKIGEEQIKITGKDKAGLLYGFMTLEQLMEDAKEQDVNLPICEIKDYPSLSYRSIHLDIKHHLEKTEYYYKLIDKLASYKINAIIAEVEDKIKFKRQPEVASPDALSIEEWQKLSNYAHERNIEISPLVQGLGHASFVLKHKKYEELRDNPMRDWAFNPLNPETYKVQFDLYLDAMEATPHGKYLHVGGDEVHTTGRRSGKSPLELQLMWLDKVCKFAEEHGRTPIFWDDMPLKHAGVYKPMFNTKLSKEEVDSIWKENEHRLYEFLDKFPKNCIYMRWNYSSPQAIGNTRAMEWFSDNGLQVMGATAGQCRWVLMPQEGSNIENIKAFAESSIDKEIFGLLCTLWDDDSPHFELYWRGIIAFAEYSWAGVDRDIPSYKSAYRHREFSNTVSNPEFAFIDELEEPVAFWKEALLRRRFRNKLAKIENPLEEAIIEFPDKDDKGDWSEMYARKLEQAEKHLKKCDSIATRISMMKSKATRNNYTLDVYECVNDLARFAPEALLALKEYDNAKTKQQEEDALKNIKQLPNKFVAIRSNMESVYGKTRILTKPENYILDQDYHSHLANQSKSFDWQFLAEILFLEKIEKEL
jgi:hypothetical protein